ncbi:hypothetical protein [Thaumasiovibrio sp. DFM-14]|uniref:hypothetical protein n=1 Tax=Thaumasiovibrio sp. DFM-14 TaxID=3384792 RepID=UPI00399FC295
MCKFGGGLGYTEQQYERLKTEPTLYEWECTPPRDKIGDLAMLSIAFPLPIAFYFLSREETGLIVMSAVIGIVLAVFSIHGESIQKLSR